MKKATFLDRDGVINRKPPEGQYVTRWEEMQFLPGVPEAVASLTKAGFCVLVVTNQRGVAKGLLSASELETIHHRMCQELAAQGALITEVYYCPHENDLPCGCRKPAPGLLLTAAREHGIDLNESWMIGDSDIDVEAGKNAGCRTVRIVNRNASGSDGADLQAGTLLHAVRQVLASKARS
jgi:D-glycero-D-manno-heptose 1,7-bisphosphate phosphatase